MGVGKSIFYIVGSIIGITVCVLLIILTTWFFQSL